MWDALILQLMNAQRELQASLVHYPANDMTTYNRIVGRHEGLEQALAAIQKIMEDNEEKY